MSYYPANAEELDAAMIEAVEEVERELAGIAELRLLVLWEFVHAA